MMKYLPLAKIKKYLRQGTSARGLALSCSLGVLFGVFPVLGIVTWLLPLLALRLSFNVALSLSLAYLLWPVQVLLWIPFLRVGEWLFGAEPLRLTTAELQATFLSDWGSSLSALGWANLHALSGWLVVALPVGAVLYWGLKWTFARTGLWWKSLRPPAK